MGIDGPLAEPDVPERWLAELGEATISVELKESMTFISGTLSTVGLQRTGGN